MTYEEVKKIRQMSTYNCPQELCTYNETGCSDCRVTRAIVLIDEAIDKQIPKKPMIHFMLSGDVYWYCPNCNEVVKSDIADAPIVDEYNHNYCGGCGQALDWSDEDDI